MCGQIQPRVIHGTQGAAKAHTVLCISQQRRLAALLAATPPPGRPPPKGAEDSAAVERFSIRRLLQASDGFRTPESESDTGSP